MDRKRRTQILANGRTKLLEHIASHIKSVHKIETILEPELGLAMLKVREYGKGELFYMGEVLITEAKVYVDEKIGVGLVLGENYEKALNLAIVDGAYNLGSSECDLFEEILTREEEKINVIEENRKNQILKTKVDFSTMEV
ncbi:MAG: phosphonate C-P lyase system protein PhnG [Sarcina sp.]